MSLNTFPALILLPLSSVVEKSFLNSSITSISLFIAIVSSLKTPFSFLFLTNDILFEKIIDRAIPAIDAKNAVFNPLSKVGILFSMSSGLKNHKP